MFLIYELFYPQILMFSESLILISVCILDLSPKFWTCISDCLLDISTLNIESESQIECVQNEAFTVLLQTPSSGIFLSFLSKWQFQLCQIGQTWHLVCFLLLKSLVCASAAFQLYFQKAFTSWPFLSSVTDDTLIQATTSAAADDYVLPLSPLLLPF